MNKDQIIARLKGILDNTASGYYVGGTLCLDYTRDSGERDVKLINVSDDTLHPEIRKLAAEVYIKNKTAQHTYWNLSHELVATA